MFEFMLLNGGAQYPGACICGSQDLPLVDTSIEIPGDYRVYLCRRCVRQSAELFGMQAADVARRREENLAEALDRIRELETEVADAQPVLQAMARASARFGGDD